MRRVREKCPQNFDIIDPELSPYKVFLIRLQYFAFSCFFLVLILLFRNCPLIVREQVWRKTSKTSNLGLRVQNVDKLTRLDAKLWPFAISRFVCILPLNCLLIVLEQVRIPCVLEHHEGMINEYEHHQAFAHQRVWASSSICTPLMELLVNPRTQTRSLEDFK